MLPKKPRPNDPMQLMIYEIIIKYSKLIGNSCFSGFLTFLVISELIIGLNWLINTLELLLIIFSVMYYYFRLINGLIS